MLKPSKDTDEKLIVRIQSGDRKALNLLVGHWHRSFCEKAYWMVKDRDVAKDIAQDSWAKIMDSIHDLRDPKQFGSWAYRIVCNKSTDWLRKQSKNDKARQPYPIDLSTDSEESHSEKMQLITMLSVTIATLPKNQKLVITLFYVNGYSLKQISELLDISVGTAKSRLFHAREKLKNTLKNNYYEN